MRTWISVTPHMITAPCCSAQTDVDWDPYYDAIPDTASALARVALPLVTRRGKAVDLGSGKGNDTRFMVQNQFAAVDSVDSSPAAALRAEALERELLGRFRFVSSKMADYDFGSQFVDWIHSNFGLPYDPDFERTVRRAYARLRFGGVLSATFIGPDDEPYRMHDGFATIDRRDLEALLAGFSSKQILENRPRAPFFDGYMKQWHYFRAICIK